MNKDKSSMTGHYPSSQRLLCNAETSSRAEFFHLIVAGSKQHAVACGRAITVTVAVILSE